MNANLKRLFCFMLLLTHFLIKPAALSAVTNRTLQIVNVINTNVLRNFGVVCQNSIKLSQLISLNDVLCSKIDAIDVTASAACNLEPVLVSISETEAILCSKIEVVDRDVLSVSDTLCTKIGNLNDPGTCLDNMITIPQDINNFQLNVIQLLKTILLELRGCCDL